MFGPKPRGHWTAALKPTPFGLLTPGVRYVVCAAFRDFDGDPHPEGESWTFLGHNFSPYDDGLSLFVSLADGFESHIPLQWRAEAQADVIDALGNYVRPAA